MYAFDSRATDSTTTEDSAAKYWNYMTVNNSYSERPEK